LQHGAGLIELFEQTCRQAREARPWADARELVGFGTNAVHGVLWELASADDDEERASRWEERVKELSALRST
jgi:hypothetical protein